MHLTWWRMAVPCLEILSFCEALRSFSFLLPSTWGLGYLAGPSLPSVPRHLLIIFPPYRASHPFSWQKRLPISFSRKAAFSYNEASLWSWESFCLIQQVHLRIWLPSSFLQPLNYKATWTHVAWGVMAPVARGFCLLSNSSKLTFLFYIPDSAHTSSLSVCYKNILMG